MEFRANRPIWLAKSHGGKSGLLVWRFLLIQTWTVAALRMKYDDGSRRFGDALLVVQISPHVFPSF